MSDRPQHEDGVLTVTRDKTKRPRMYVVLLHNDDYTTQEFVLEILKSFFHRNATDAQRIMLTVHHKGQGIAGTYSRDVAESKVAQVTAYAREQGAPLKLTAEPA